jgi:hypothetical protein
LSEAMGEIMFEEFFNYYTVTEKMILWEKHGSSLLLINLQTFISKNNSDFAFLVRIIF